MLKLAFAAAAATLALAGPAAAAPVWLPPAPLSATSVTAGADSDVAVGGDGVAIAVWLRVANGAAGVQASIRPPGGAWGAPRDLSAQGANAHSPRVALDAHGNALVIWTEDTAGGAVVRERTRAAGGDFGSIDALSLGGTASNQRSAVDPVLALSPGGAAVVAWVRSNGAALVVQAVARDSAGEAFGLPDDLSDTAATSRRPAVAIDAAGDIVTVWSSDVSGAPYRDVEAAARPAHGQWQPRQMISFPDKTGYDPDVAFDAAGVAEVAWDNNGGLGYAERSASPSFAAGTWGAPIRAAAGIPPAMPRVAVDGDGTTVVVDMMYTDNSYFYALATRPPGGVFNQSPLINGYAAVNGSIQWGLAAGFRGGVLAFYKTRDGLRSALRPTGGPTGIPQDVVAPGTTTSGRVGFAGDEQGNAIGVWEQPVAGGYRMFTADFDAAPPVIGGVSVPETVTVGAEAGMQASATDRLTGATLAWSFGDGARADGASVSHVFTSAGAREVVVTARDGAGNAASVARTIQVLDPPPPARRIVDDDGDGFEPPLDCNDDNRAINPAAAEIPGNVVDENCDGRREPYAQVSATALLTALPLGDRTTRLLGLKLRDVAAGDSVRLRCTGRGCRKAMTRTLAIRKPAKTLDLTRYVKNARLRAGARLEVRVLHAARIARVFTYVMRAGGSGTPRVIRRCQAPDASAVRTC